MIETADATVGLPFLDTIVNAEDTLPLLDDFNQFGEVRAFSDFFAQDAVGYFTRDEIKTLSHENQIAIK